jgi:hypothetical protein
VQLPEGQPVIDDMFEEVVAYHHIYRTFRKRNMLYVEVHICKWRLQISGYVSLFALFIVLLEVAHKRNLGSNVKQTRMGGEEVAMTLQPEPYHAVTFQRQAART